MSIISLKKENLIKQLNDLMEREKEFTKKEKEILYREIWKYSQLKQIKNLINYIFSKTFR